MISDFSSVTIDARKWYNNAFQVWRENYFELGISTQSIYQSSKYKGKINDVFWHEKIQIDFLKTVLENVCQPNTEEIQEHWVHWKQRNNKNQE